MAKNNYSTTEHEGLAMVYALHKFRHYLLGTHLKMIIDLSALKYLAKITVMGGNIFIWLFLFQEYDFEVIVKPGRLNAGPDHLFRFDTSEEPTNIEEGLPDAELFAIRVFDDNFVDIIQFITTGVSPAEYTTQKKKELVVEETNFSFIVRHFYNMGADEILRRYVPKHERHIVLVEAHGGVARRHYAGKATVQKIL